MKFRMIPHYRGSIFATVSPRKLKRRKRDALAAEIFRFAALAVTLPVLAICGYQILLDLGFAIDGWASGNLLAAQIKIMADNLAPYWGSFPAFGFPAILIGYVAIHLAVNEIVDVAMYD